MKYLLYFTPRVASRSQSVPDRLVLQTAWILPLVWGTANGADRSPLGGTGDPPGTRVAKWVLSFPIPLRYMFAAHPDLLSPVLQGINRAISTFLIKQAGLKRTEAQTGAVTLIQRFGSAANLNIASALPVSRWRLSRIAGGVPVFQPVRAPTAEPMQALLARIIKRLMTNLPGAK